MNLIQIIFYAHKVAFPSPLCIVLIYIQTFMVFPGMALEKKFNSDLETWVY